MKQQPHPTGACLTGDTLERFQHAVNGILVHIDDRQYLGHGGAAGADLHEGAPTAAGSTTSSAYQCDGRLARQRGSMGAVRNGNHSWALYGATRTGDALRRDGGATVTHGSTSCWPGLLSAHVTPWRATRLLTFCCAFTGWHMTRMARRTHDTAMVGVEAAMAAAEHTGRRDRRPQMDEVGQSHKRLLSAGMNLTHAKVGKIEPGEVAELRILLALGRSPGRWGITRNAGWAGGCCCWERGRMLLLGQALVSRNYTYRRSPVVLSRRRGESSHLSHRGSYAAARTRVREGPTVRR